MESFFVIHALWLGLEHFQDCRIVDGEDMDVTARSSAEDLGELL
jgi:hypothetical protein